MKSVKNLALVLLILTISQALRAGESKVTESEDLYVTSRPLDKEWNVLNQYRPQVYEKVGLYAVYKVRKARSGYTVIEPADIAGQFLYPHYVMPCPGPSKIMEEAEWTAFVHKLLPDRPLPRS